MIATSFAVWKPSEEADEIAALISQYPEDVDVSPAVGHFAFPNGIPTTHTCLHGFTFTDKSGERSYGAALWIQKQGISLTVMGRSPFWQAFAAFLVSSIDPDLRPRVVVNFISETPDPQHGQSITQSLLGVTIRRPPLNTLPLLDLPCRIPFECLGVDNTIFIVAALLCERHILLLSSCLSLLAACAEILMGFCWPILPQGVYVPMVPSSLVDIVGHPVPFLLGMHRSNLEVALRSVEPHSIIVDLDEGTVKEVEAITVAIDARSDKKSVYKFTGFPTGRPVNKLKQRLVAALTNEKKARSLKSAVMARSISSGAQPVSEPGSEFSVSSPTVGKGTSNSESFAVTFGCHPYSDDTFDYSSHCLSAGSAGNSALRSAFINLLIDYFADYAQYCNPEFTNGIDDKGFLKHLGSHSFFQKVVHSQGWSVFISKRTPPHRTEGDVRDFLLFDEYINVKRNRAIRIRKLPTPLLDLELEISSYKTQRLASPTSSLQFPLARPIHLEEQSLPSIFRVDKTKKEGSAARTPQSSVYCSWLASWTHVFKNVESPELAFAMVDMARDILDKVKRSDNERKGNVKTPVDEVMSILLQGIAQMNCAKNVRMDVALKLYTWMQQNDRLGSKTLRIFFEQFATNLAAARVRPSSKNVRTCTPGVAENAIAAKEQLERIVEPGLIQLRDQVGFRLQLRLIACTTTQKCATAEFVEDKFLDKCTCCGVAARHIKGILGTSASVTVRLLLPDEIYGIVLKKDGVVDDIEVFISCLWHFRRLNLFSRHLFTAFRAKSIEISNDSFLDVVQTKFGPPEDEELTWRRLEQMKMTTIDLSEALETQVKTQKTLESRWNAEKKFIVKSNERMLQEVVELAEREANGKEKLEEEVTLLRSAVTVAQTMREDLEKETERLRQERDFLIASSCSEIARLQKENDTLQGLAAAQAEDVTREKVKTFRAKSTPISDNHQSSSPCAWRSFSCGSEPPRGAREPSLTGCQATSSRAPTQKELNIDEAVESTRKQPRSIPPQSDEPALKETALNAEVSCWRGGAQRRNHFLNWKTRRGRSRVRSLSIRCIADSDKQRSGDDEDAELLGKLDEDDTSEVATRILARHSR